MSLAVREYRDGDFEHISSNGNEFIDEYSEGLIGSGLEYNNTYVFTDDDKPFAIFLYKQYDRDRYYVCIFCIENLNRKHVAMLKDYWGRFIETYKPIRLETTSIACEKLDRWHEFFGLKKEGTKRNYLGGKDYDMWGMVLDGN